MDRITCVQLYVNRLLDTITDAEEHRTAAVSGKSAENERLSGAASTDWSTENATVTILLPWKKCCSRRLLWRLFDGLRSKILRLWIF